MSKNNETFITLQNDALPPPRTHASEGAALQQSHQSVLAAATSANTRRTYRSAIRHFQAWGGMLPCDELAIVRYLLAFAALLNPRTQSLRLCALSQWHRSQGFTDPTSTPTVRKTLRGIERLHGRPRRKAKALPLADLERIVIRLEQVGGMVALRDNALLQLGYFGAFRRSELVALTVAEVSVEAEGLLVTLPRSKTDQDGQGVVKAIPWGDDVCCPAKALRQWLDAAEIGDGPLFRGITCAGKIKQSPLSASCVNLILRQHAKAAGLDYVPVLASHSLRRGLATSAHRAGADFSAIKRQGGWRHDGTVQGYIEEAGRFADNAAGVLLRRSK